MGIVCYCPGGHRVKVKDEFAGKKGICPTCRARFRIPMPSVNLVVSGALAPGVSVSPDPGPAAAMPGVLPLAVEAAAASWCVALPGGEASPPMSGAALLEWLASGRATGAELVWRSDWPDWIAIHKVFPEHVRPQFPGAAAGG